MPPRVRRPDPPTYPHAAEPLTTEQVREQYGPLLDRFYAALHEDGHLLADIATAVVKGCEKRDRVIERLARDRQAKAERDAGPR